MISILGICMIVAYFPLVFFSLDSAKSRTCKRMALIVAICVALFTNIGTVINGISYSRFASYMYLAISTINMLHQKKLSVNKKVLQAAVVLSVALLMGIIYLASPIEKPEVIPMSTKIDDVYLGAANVQEAELTYSNFSALFDMLVFVIGLMVSREFFGNKEDVSTIFNTLRKCYCVFFLLVTTEWIVNNVVSPTLIRNMVLDQRFIGSFDTTKVYYPRNRLGFYGFTGLYSEESYISMLLLFFCIFYVQGIHNLKEFLQYLWGIAVCIMSGCTTGLFIVCFPVALLIIRLFRMIRSRISISNLLIISAVFMSGIMCIIIGICYADTFVGIIENAKQKLEAVFWGVSIAANSELRSGAIRNYGNQVVLNAFMKSPVVGVGIGTTRGYGILSGLLATFGIVGIFAYLNFICQVMGLRLRGKWMLLIVLLAYFSTILSVFYVYSYMIIPYMLLFSRKMIVDTPWKKTSMV